MPLVLIVLIVLIVLAVLSLAGMNNRGRERNSAGKSVKVGNLARYLSRGKLIRLL